MTNESQDQKLKARREQARIYAREYYRKKRLEEPKSIIESSVAIDKIKLSDCDPKLQAIIKRYRQQFKEFFPDTQYADDDPDK